MLRFVLCDDNVQVLSRLAKILEKIFFKNSIEAQVVLQATTPDEVLEYTNINPVDVLFLDINLKSTVSGCDVADIVRRKNKNIYIIFLNCNI